MSDGGGTAIAVSRPRAASVSRPRPFAVRKAGAYLLLAVVAILVAFPLLIALSYSTS